jgi:hypothetical protein
MLQTLDGYLSLGFVPRSLPECFALADDLDQQGECLFFI